MRILYIDIDSLRPDHLGCYGYSRATSPNIDTVAGRGVRWTRCHTSDAPCMPSRTSLFSGQFGIRHGCVSHVGPRAVPFPDRERRAFTSQYSRESWMQQLRDAGYRTASFSSFADRHSAFHWTAGFTELHDNGGRGHESADAWMPEALDWLDRRGETDNWFLHLNFWDVHVPYRTPASFGNRFADTPALPAWIDQRTIDAHNGSPGIRSAANALFLQYADRRPDLNPAKMKTLDDFQLMIDGYDTAIAYVDLWIGNVLEKLDALGIRDETAIIVSADHGECLGELNAYAGHCFADACTTRIPLIIDWPGLSNRPGSVETGLAYHLDLAPTVCELTGAAVPDPWDGTSLLPALRGETNGSRDFVVSSQLAQTCQRSVRFDDGKGDYLYLRTYRSRGYPFPEEQLFDLAQDPHETKDVSGECPQLVEKGRKLLEQWREDCLGRSANPDPLDEVLANPTEAQIMQGG